MSKYNLNCRNFVKHISGGKENVSLAEALNQARLPIIDFKTCRQKKFWGDRVRDSMICAGFRDTEDPPAACQVGLRSGTLDANSR